MTITEFIDRIDAMIGRPDAFAWMPQLREHSDADMPGPLAYDGEALAPMSLSGWIDVARLNAEISAEVRWPPPRMADLSTVMRQLQAAFSRIAPALHRAARAMRPLAIAVAPEGTRLAACRHYRTKRVTARQYRAYRRMLARRETA